MGLVDVLQRLRFRAISPQDVVPTFKGHGIEKANVSVDPSDHAAWQALSPLEHIPAFGTLANALLLYTAVAEMPIQQVYLNIGIWQGFSLIAGMVVEPLRLCIGVDNFSEFGAPREAAWRHFQQHAKLPYHHLIEADYRRVLSDWRHPIGVYFYDGPHSADDQCWALEHAHPFLAPGARIFVDDTNQGPPRDETLAFLARHPDYRLLADLTTAQNGHPTFWNGLMILEKSL